SEARSLGWRWNTSRFVFNRLRSRTSRFINRMIPGVKHRRRDSRQLLKDLRRDLETIDVEPVAKRNEDTSASDRPADAKILEEVCSRISPSSVRGVGGDAALEARVWARAGAGVVSLEADRVRAARLYAEAQDAGLPVLSLVMDFVKPTPSIGFSSHYSIAANERLKCDLVWAPMLVDGLVLEKHLRFELIAEVLSLFTKRCLVVGVP